MRRRFMLVAALTALAPVALIVLLQGPHPHVDWSEQLKLAGIVLLLGLAIGWFAGLRLVRPIEALRDALMTRAVAALPGDGVALQRSDDIGELSRAFDALLKALHDRAGAQLSMLSDVAHEMKSPIAAIRSAQESLPDATPEQRTKLSALIGTSIMRLDALVHEMLELGRAEAGLPGYQRERVDVAALLRGMCDDRCQLQVQHFEMLADVTSLERALRNIIDNALAFAKDKVMVSLSDGVVTVRDDGPGIADPSRAFQRFYTTRPGGTGLGLAMSRAIIEAHGGRVTAKNDGGAVFVISLPGDAKR